MAHESINSASVVRINVKGSKGLSEVFVKGSKQFSETLVKEFKSAAPELVKGIEKNFLMRGKREGREEWTITQNPRPLIDRGNLYKSFEAVVDEQGYTVAIMIGTDVPYAQIHNEGGTTETDVVYSSRKQGGSHWIHTGSMREIDIPEREFMFIVSEDAEEVGFASGAAFDDLAEAEGLVEI